MKRIKVKVILPITVKIYSATVPDNGNGTATVDVCSAHHTFDDGWTTVPNKNKKERELVGFTDVDAKPKEKLVAVKRRHKERQSCEISRGCHSPKPSRM
jgi:hypothetical protein